MEKLKITITNVKILNNYFTGSYNTDIHKGIIREVGGSSNYCVLLSLVSHADNTTKESYPSMETIANEIGASTRTVIRVLADLEKRGYITRELVNSTKSRQKHNIYTLHLSEYAPEDENNGSDVERLFAHFKNKFREKYNLTKENKIIDQEIIETAVKKILESGEIKLHIDEVRRRNGY